VTVLEVVVGRQPVFDRDRNVVGYELLYRDVAATGLEAQGSWSDEDDLMTSTVLFSSVAIGIARLVGDKLAFCNAGRRVLVGADPVVLPPSQTVIEVDSAITADDEVVAGCGQLVGRGFLLALDHYRADPSSERLEALASIVKIDPAGLAVDELAALVARSHDMGAIAVAERVETTAELERCRRLGFDLFQGYALSRPRLVPGRMLDASSLGRLRLAAALLETETSADRLEEIVRAEPAMAYQLLQVAGLGADHGLRRRVQSLREALVLVGWRRLQSWVAFLLLTCKGTTSAEEVTTALARARACELLAARIDARRAGLAFVAGMVSSFDVLLGMPIEEVLLTLPLDGELHEAVLGKGEVGSLVADVADHQAGMVTGALRSGIDEVSLHKASLAGLAWAVRVAAELMPSSKEATPRAVLLRGQPGAKGRARLGPAALGTLTCRALGGRP
jgi:EAL and modified HD-GYP domain-containing signal transduction protein